MVAYMHVYIHSTCTALLYMYISCLPAADNTFSLYPGNENVRNNIVADVRRSKTSMSLLSSKVIHMVKPWDMWMKLYPRKVHIGMQIEGEYLS